MKQKTLREQMKAYKAGRYANPDSLVQVEAGWVDWFCKDTALAGKTKKLYGKISKIIKSHKFDPDKVYVFFKNNCPMNGPLYDSFSICDINSDNVLYCITPSCSHNNKGKAEEYLVYGVENKFKGSLVLGEWRDVVKFFMTTTNSVQFVMDDK